MAAQGLMSSLPVPAFLQGQSGRTFSTTPRQRRLTIENINQNVVEAEYAVRGELAIKSEKYREQLKNKDTSLPFDTIISANIGNPQQLDQKPITFFRQVLSLMENPLLLEHPDVLTKTLGYKQDAIDRAKTLLADVKSVGAYSASKGASGIRHSVANFIEKRDGFPADPENIFLSAGASGGVSTLMNVMCADANSGILVPIPQYPLYTATLALLNAKCVPYELEEEKSWGTNLEAIRTSYAKAKAEGTSVRSIVIINPGNPTGATLSVEDIKSVLTFAAEEKLVVMADEVYQTNVFVGKFTSFKQCLRELQKSEENKDGKFDTLELVSLHSISKGMVGECGHRGGYFELVGFDEKVSPAALAHSSLHQQLTSYFRSPSKSTSTSAFSSALPLSDNASSLSWSSPLSRETRPTKPTTLKSAVSSTASRSAPPPSTKLSVRWKECPASHPPAPCTSSLPSHSLPRLLRRPSKKAETQTNTTA
jgi:alanine transaminase